MIYFVLASTKDGVIGLNNRLPWNIPADLQVFKQITLNKKILMGRKTFLSLGSKPLPKRINYVLTSNLNYKVNNPEVIICYDYKKIIKNFANNENDDIYIIGGSQIFKIFQEYATFVYLNIIKKSYSGDTKIDLQALLINFSLIYKKNHNEFFETLYKKNNYLLK